MQIIVFLLLCFEVRQFAGQLVLDVQPNVTYVNKGTNVTVSCSLNMTRPKTDLVYSIMIKRRRTTCAVVFKDGSYEISDKHIHLESFVLNTSYAHLNLHLRNVTCVDRGDYSCKMAVRRSFRNFQLGPVISHLKVIGNPSDVVFKVYPQKTVYTNGEYVRVVCSALQRTRVYDWHWVSSNQSLGGSFETCVYSDEHCLYRCSSTITHQVSIAEKDVTFACYTGGSGVNVTLDVRNVSVSNDLFLSGHTSVTGNETNLFTGVSNLKGTQTHILIAIASITLALITTFLIVFCHGIMKSQKEEGFPFNGDYTDEGVTQLLRREDRKKLNFIS